MPFVNSMRGSYGPQGVMKRTGNKSGITGGSITTAGGYRIHTFTADDTLDTTPFGLNISGVEYMIVAGGGNDAGPHGWGYSGGAGGGMITGTTSLSANTQAAVDVGTTNRTNSTALGITATMGGYGRASGGSGGGGDRGGGGGAAGIPGQGNPGGPGGGGDYNWYGGGGGGAGGAGRGNSGGHGLSSSITGSAVVYSAGRPGGNNEAGGGRGANGSGYSNTGYGHATRPGIIVIRYPE